MINADNAEAAAKVEKKYLAEEPMLLDAKWLDYRYLSAVAATELFAKEYLATYRYFAIEWPGLGDPQHTAPIRERVLANSPRIVTALWRARQAADQMGIPYDRYLWPAFELFRDKHTSRPPAPNQLYSEQVWNHVLEKWDVYETATGLLAAMVTDIRFLSKNYRGDPPQDAHHGRLLKSVSKRHGSDQIRALQNHIHGHEWLPELVARNFFGDELINRVSVEPRTGYKPDKGDLSDYQPSCFGLPYAHSDGGEICAKCEFYDRCAVAVSDAFELVRDLHGTADPRADRKREAARLRQRRSRAAKKAENG